MNLPSTRNGNRLIEIPLLADTSPNSSSAASSEQKFRSKLCQILTQFYPKFLLLIIFSSVFQSFESYQSELKMMRKERQKLIRIPSGGRKDSQNFEKVPSKLEKLQKNAKTGKNYSETWNLIVKTLKLYQPTEKLLKPLKFPEKVFKLVQKLLPNLKTYCENPQTQ